MTGKCTHFIKINLEQLFSKMRMEQVKLFSFSAGGNCCERARVKCCLISLTSDLQKVMLQHTDGGEKSYSGIIKSDNKL